MPSKAELSHNLKIAKSCIKDLVQDLNEGTASADNGKVYQVLAFKWGIYPIMIIDMGSYVAVKLQTEVPKEAREKLAKLPDEVREQYRIAFFQELMSNHRTGTMAKPQNLNDIKELESLDVLQNIHLTDGPLSCNRLVDGIQEIVSVTVRAINVISFGLGLSATVNQPIKPAPDIYG
jgi:hypothetical protein